MVFLLYAENPAHVPGFPPLQEGFLLLAGGPKVHEMGWFKPSICCQKMHLQAHADLRGCLYDGANVCGTFSLLT
jgi:hypothetical protein